MSSLTQEKRRTEEKGRKEKKVCDRGSRGTATNGVGGTATKWGEQPRIERHGESTYGSRKERPAKGAGRQEYRLAGGTRMSKKIAGKGKCPNFGAEGRGEPRKRSPGTRLDRRRQGGEMKKGKGL